jgi:hypothetical protein
MTTDTALHPLVGTYSWAHGATPEQIATGEVGVLRVEAVGYRVVGITSGLHFFRCAVGIWTRNAIPATAEDWQRAVLKNESRTLQRSPLPSDSGLLLKDWHEDDGPVLWWCRPVEEPPYAGTPLDADWPGYHTHWTPIVVPQTFAVDMSQLGEGHDN